MADNPIRFTDPNGLDVLVFEFGGLGDDSATIGAWSSKVNAASQAHISIIPYNSWAPQNAQDAFRDYIQHLTTRHSNGCFDSLVVLGHSYGGQSTADFLALLKTKRVSADSVVTVDPRHPWPNPITPFDAQKPFEMSSNAFIWENFYEDEQPFLGGAIVDSVPPIVEG
jgi:pimeloyl-ACP methyl ester carboxylesterase